MIKMIDGAMAVAVTSVDGFGTTVKVKELILASQTVTLILSRAMQMG